MLNVGLTGSIAVGKSFVCGQFRKLGCHVLDADKTARDVVAIGTAGLAQIVDNFGPAVLQQNGELDRKKLGSIVFADEEKRKLLNAIVHPLVMEAEDRWLRDREHFDPKGIAIIDAALLIESGGYKRFDKIIVVWCDSAIQLKRLMLRDSITESEATVKIKAQMSQDEKKQYSDFLIDTSDGFEAAADQSVAVYRQLTDLIKI